MPSDSSSPKPAATLEFPQTLGLANSVTKNLPAFLLLLALSACSRSSGIKADPAKARAKLEAIPLGQKVELTNAEWQAILLPSQFYVMRRAGTERPSKSGNAIEHHTGVYVCAACGNPLYRAETKFDSSTGWPSFWQPLKPDAIQTNSGISAIFGREVSCARCGSHLGHVFNDGPPPTGLRYCMNAVALSYQAAP